MDKLKEKKEQMLLIAIIVTAVLVLLSITMSIISDTYTISSWLGGSEETKTVKYSILKANSDGFINARTNISTVVFLGILSLLTAIGVIVVIVAKIDHEHIDNIRFGILICCVALIFIYIISTINFKGDFADDFGDEVSYGFAFFCAVVSLFTSSFALFMYKIDDSIK